MGDTSLPLSTEVDTDVIHVIKYTRPSPSVFAYCKNWTVGKQGNKATNLCLQAVGKQVTPVSDAPDLVMEAGQLIRFAGHLCFNQCSQCFHVMLQTALPYSKDGLDISYTVCYYQI